MRRKQSIIHVDKNHSQIVTYLRARNHDIEIVETFDPLDLLVYRCDTGLAGWIEIKTDARNNAFTVKQLKFIAETSMPVCIAMNEDVANLFCTTFDAGAVTQKQKDNIAMFLLDTTDTSRAKKQYHPAVIERVLAW